MIKLKLVAKADWMAFGLLVCLAHGLTFKAHVTEFQKQVLFRVYRSWCQVRVSGSFSVAEMTSWLTEALPGDLPRPSSNVVFARSHTLLKTILVCQYQYVVF